MIHGKQPNYAGIPSLSIPKGYLKVALKLLISGIQCIKVKYNFDNNTHENPITMKLVAEMNAEQELSGYKIRVDIFPDILCIPTSPNKIGELDIRFTWDNYSPYSYLAVEAKRLFGSGSTLAGKYVDEGVMDFVNGKYSVGHDYGIMLGYILLNPIQNALLAVERALNNRKNKTNEISSFSKSKYPINYSLVYESAHLQKDKKQKIMIFHIFMDLAS